MHTVIVVDDHPAIRLAVRSALESAGEFEVVGEAGDGPTALATIREERPTWSSSTSTCRGSAGST